MPDTDADILNRITGRGSTVSQNTHLPYFWNFLFTSKIFDWLTVPKVVDILQQVR
jgi:hypothetical protein